MATVTFILAGVAFEQQVNRNPLKGKITPMKSKATIVEVDEAKSDFPALLGRLDRGAEVTITVRGRPAARLLPAVQSVNAARLKATTELRQLRQRYSLKGLSVRDLINEGRT